ncbi:MAG: hypothetical protein Q8Q00_14175 [Dehalococcoidia bacterium]|nr:hypothetical protein [Dehalococcoidia bacterium]
MRSLALTITLTVLVGLGSLMGAGTAMASTVVVDDDGQATAADCDSATATPYTTISAAVTASAGGDTIGVCPGTYDERLVIDKQLTLSGSGGGSTIVQNTAVPSGPNAGDFADVQLTAGASGAVIQDISFDFNGTDGTRQGWGIVISDFNGPTVTGVQILNNEIFLGKGSGAASIGEGVGIQTGKNADVGGLLVSGNSFHGDQAAGVGSEGIYINPVAGGGSVTIADNTFDGHLFVGVSIESGNVSVSNNTIVDTIAPNTAGTHGLRVNDFVGGVSYSGIALSGNAIDGFENGMRLGSSASASSTLTINAQGNVITGNTRGVWVRYDAVPTIEGGIICGNTAGIEVLSSAVFSAEGNWWGDASGPTHPGNAGGSGDSVVDGGNGGSGTVDFDPWVDTISGSADAATAGSPSGVSFQFSDAGGTVFLGEGAGPFEVTTDNGTVSPSPAFINAAEGTVEVTLTPASEGTATVTITGPCGLDDTLGGNSVTLDVAAAPVAPTPTPSQLPLTGGQPASGADVPWLAMLFAGVTLAGAGGALVAVRRRR